MGKNQMVIIQRKDKLVALVLKIIILNLPISQLIERNVK